MTRRRMLGLGGAAAAGLLLAGCGTEGSGGTSPATTSGTTGGGGAGARGIVFNTGSKNVTLFDPGKNRVTGTRPTNAAVRWLSNEQHYFDGERIWTYDYPDGEVQAIAIDPESFEVTSRIPVGGDGPGHSFVLSPDNERGFVNSAGSDFLAVVNPGAGEVVDQVQMGAYP